MITEPQNEHRWLGKLMGDWTYETATHGPDGSPATYTGTESVRSLGGFWAVAEADGDTPGGMGSSITAIGYDPDEACYVSSVVVSMMSHLWISRGTVDQDGSLRLECDGPAFDGDGTSRYRDVIAFNGDDERTMTSYVRGKDGEWSEFMKTTYRRTA